MLLAEVVAQRRRRSTAWTASIVAAIPVIAALLLLPFVFRLDGKPHADWQQFLGRFHPLAIHLPIGLILLVPILEIGGRIRPALREAAGFVLSLSVFASMGALALGYLLAYGSGTAGAGVTRHMWGGISLTIVILLCALLRPLWVSHALPLVYPALLAFAVGLMAWAAHQGGTITYGPNYLTRYLPSSLKRLPFLGASYRAQLNPNSFYTQHIDPIFDANCVSCHGEASEKGGLRLDSYASLMTGGKDGAVVAPDHPEKSDLYRRIVLPSGNKDSMPAEGKPPLKPEEIAWIKAWIAQGASPTAVTLAGVTVSREYREAVLPQVGDYRALMPAIEQMDSSPGVRLLPVSAKAGDGLILETIDAGQKFGDVQLAQLDRFAPYIVEAELGRTGVTDACLDTLQKFKNLRALHLEDTVITGHGLQKLTSLSHLSYLNLSGTKVTRSAIAPLTSMKGLSHLYLFDTPAEPAPPSASPSKPLPSKDALLRRPS